MCLKSHLVEVSLNRRHVFISSNLQYCRTHIDHTFMLRVEYIIWAEYIIIALRILGNIHLVLYCVLYSRPLSDCKINGAPKIVKISNNTYATFSARFYFNGRSSNCFARWSWLTNMRTISL